MNERQRLLMQKIAEYGDAKYMVGSDYSMHIDQGARINGALTLFREIEQMVTEWVPMKQEGPSDESPSDLRVVVPQNVTEPYSNKDVTTNVTTRRKKDDLDREVGL